MSKFDEFLERQKAQARDKLLLGLRLVEANAATCSRALADHYAELVEIAIHYRKTDDEPDEEVDAQLRATVRALESRKDG
jgi:hypothetical protein